MTVKQKLKYKSANVAMFRLNTDIYYLDYTHFWKSYWSLFVFWRWYFL